MKMQNEMCSIEHWSTNAVNLVEQLFADAADVIFIPDIKISDHYFGRVQILKHCGNKTDPVEMLINMDQAIISRNFLIGKNAFYDLCSPKIM